MKQSKPKMLTMSINLPFEWTASRSCPTSAHNNFGIRQVDLARKTWRMSLRGKRTGNGAGWRRTDNPREAQCWPLSSLIKFFLLPGQLLNNNTHILLRQWRIKSSAEHSKFGTHSQISFLFTNGPQAWGQGVYGLSSSFATISQTVLWSDATKFHSGNTKWSLGGSWLKFRVGMCHT